MLKGELAKFDPDSNTVTINVDDFTMLLGYFRLYLNQGDSGHKKRVFGKEMFWATACLDVCNRNDHFKDVD